MTQLVIYQLLDIQFSTFTTQYKIFYFVIRNHSKICNNYDIDSLFSSDRVCLLMAQTLSRYNNRIQTKRRRLIIFLSCSTEFMEVRSETARNSIQPDLGFSFINIQIYNASTIILEIERAVAHSKLKCILNSNYYYNCIVVFIINILILILILMISTNGSLMIIFHAIYELCESYHYCIMFIIEVIIKPKSNKTNFYL